MRDHIDSTHDGYASLLSPAVKYAVGDAVVTYGPMSTMGQRIKTLREAKGLTQDQLAEQVGVTRAAVSLWEVDATKNIKNVTMLALVRVLGTTHEYLLFGPQSERDAAGRYGKARPG